METSQSTPQQPDDANAGPAEEPEAGEFTPSTGPGDAADPTPAPEACHGEAEATGEAGGAAEDPGPGLEPDPRIAELESKLQAAADDLANLAADRDRLTTEAEAARSNHSEALAAVERERDEARREAQEAAERHAEIFAAWSDVVIKDAILGGLAQGKHEFLGVHPDTKARYCRDFLKLIGGTEAFTVERKPGGAWIVRSRDGIDIKTFVDEKVEEYGHFFKARHHGSAGFVGGHGRLPDPARPGSIEAIADSYNARKALNKPRY